MSMYVAQFALGGATTVVVLMQVWWERHRFGGRKES